MNWISFKDRMPDPTKDELVLGYDVYFDNPRMHSCETLGHDGKSLSVRKSICPYIGDGEHAHWMEYPPDDSPLWIPFIQQDYPHDSFHEVIVKLHIGVKYVGYIQAFWFAPSFNTMTKSVDLDAISHYMELPNAPVV